ncbi:MAG: non-heme iron oxygenase ferredoxin subunit [Burkholderiales bacterium]|nr:non-heme iron oxygenase ferredoxin subunit [Burkholderiales bacterium]
MSEAPREEWVTVALRADLGAGGMIAVAFGDYQIALYDVGGEILATDSTCTHAEGLLTDGTLQGEIVECPLHGGRFSVRTGKGMGPPIPCDLKTYPVRVVEGEIQVRLPDLF